MNKTNSDKSRRKTKTIMTNPENTGIQKAIADHQKECRKRARENMLWNIIRDAMVGVPEKIDIGEGAMRAAWAIEPLLGEEVFRVEEQNCPETPQKDTESSPPESMEERFDRFWAGLYCNDCEQGNEHERAECVAENAPNFYWRRKMLRNFFCQEIARSDVALLNGMIKRIEQTPADKGEKRFKEYIIQELAEIKGRSKELLK